MKKILIPLLILAMLCCSLPAMAAGNTLMFDKNVNTVFEGETLQTVLIREGTLAEGTVTYQSNNPKSATVDDEGIVTGIEKGRVTIMAILEKDNKTYRTQLNLTVARKATSVEVDTSKLPLYQAGDERIAGLLAERENAEENALPVLVIPVKKSYTLQITVMPKDATNRKATVSSSDETVVRARGGSITAQQAGEAIVTVANELSPEVKTQFRVLAVTPVTRITPVVSAKSVAVGGTVQLSAEVTPADAALPGVVWTSTDERIATVDANGVVTGVKRGTARLVASVTDGSNTRANLSLKVTQNAEEITLNQEQAVVDTGRTIVLRATVLPKDTDDKNVIWSSSDESIATVNSQGRVTGVSLGTCEILCTSKTAEGVTAKATVTVQQPVKKVTFEKAPEVYTGETGQLKWTIEPANASNPTLKLTSSNEKIFTVDADGTIHGVSQGEAWLNAVTTDGTDRRVRMQVKILQHVEGVHMRRQTAYVDVREAATTSAVLEPENATNKNMTWESADPSIATAEGTNTRVRITGKSKGVTVVTGTTEDGGFKTSIVVKIGDWDHALKLRSFTWNDDAIFSLQVRNNSELNITRITAEISFYEAADDGPVPIPVNTKDGSETVTAIWKKPLGPNETTNKASWQMQNYQAPADMSTTRGVVRIISYEIDNDWVKTIRKVNRPESEW